MCSVHPLPAPEAARETSLQSEADARLTAAGLDLLRQAYAAEQARRPGLRPVVALRETIPVWVTRDGETVLARQPVFEIVDWTPQCGFRDVDQ